MQDSTEEAIFLSSSGDAEILRPSKAASRQECCGEVRSFTRPAGKGMYARGKGGYAYGFSSHPQTILVPYDCWQSDEVHPGCAWIEVVAPAGKALAQLQVTLPVTGHQCVDSFTPEHVQLFIAEDNDPFADTPIFEHYQFWSLGFPGEPIPLPGKDLLPHRTTRARLYVKRAAQGGRNVRIRGFRVLTKSLKRRREMEIRLVERLWNTQDFTDMIIQCSDGAEVKAHRSVLAIASPVFHCMLLSPMKEGVVGGTVSLPCNEAVVRALLRHCYGMPYENDLSLEDELALVGQAHAFELVALCEEAAVSAIERLSPETATPLIKGLRTFYKAGSLKEAWDCLVRQIRASPKLCEAVLLTS